MPQSIVAVLSVLLLSLSLISAAPHASSYSPSIFNAAHHSPSPRPWRRLSDAIVRMVWGLPENHQSLGADKDAEAPDGTPVRKVLAHYGDDIVMRFTIGTVEEASALAEAARILFLDVWEFNDDWVDIRIAKGVVSYTWLPCRLVRC